jgi:hypothetical protein
VVEASLAAAQAAPQRTPDSVARETDDAIYTETRAPDGTWIHRSFVPKLAQAVDAPDAVIANILQSGEVNGQPITSLGDVDVVLAQDAASGQWSATISPSLVSLARFVESEWRARERERSNIPWLLALLPWAFGAVVVLLRRGAVALGRGLRRLGRAIATGLVQAARPVVAATGVVAVGMLVAILRLFIDAAAAFASLWSTWADRALRLAGPALRPVPLYVRPALRGPAH